MKGHQCHSESLRGSLSLRLAMMAAQSESLACRGAGPRPRPAAAALPGATPSHESLTLGIRASFKMATLVPCRVQAVGPVTVSL